MGGRLCPNCGHFALELKVGEPGQKDRYVCDNCHESFPIEGPSVSLDRDSVQRFPNPNDIGAESPLERTLRRKKQ